jgi:hypothetical protein
VLTLLRAKSLHAMVDGLTIASPTEGDVFLACVEQVLCPKLQARDVVVIDNLSAGCLTLVEQRQGGLGGISATRNPKFWTVMQLFQLRQSLTPRNVYGECESRRRVNSGVCDARHQGYF